MFVLNEKSASYIVFVYWRQQCDAVCVFFLSYPGAPRAQVLTEENVRALRESVKTLTRTLEHVESISGDVGGLTGDGRVKANVRQLIEALSRITSD